jgi:hypothetical protein
MGLLENRFIRAVAFLIVIPTVVVTVGILRGEPIGENLFLGVISGLVFAFLSIFLRIGGPEWGDFW